MDTVPRPEGDTSAALRDTTTERQRRLAWEAEMIAEADADIAAGRLIDEADIDAWIDSIGIEHELPPPRSRRWRPGGRVPRRLSYTENARNDLDAVRRWLTQPGSGPIARRRLVAIRTDIRRLKR